MYYTLYNLKSIFISGITFWIVQSRIHIIVRECYKFYNGIHDKNEKKNKQMKNPNIYSK